MLRCEAWGKTSSISTDWAKKLTHWLNFNKHDPTKSSVGAEVMQSSKTQQLQEAYVYVYKHFGGRMRACNHGGALVLDSRDH